MTRQRFPDLDPEAIARTREALHAYARVLGDWLKSIRARRKHWWHASLRPSLRGLTTGVVHASPGFELELDLVSSPIQVSPHHFDLSMIWLPGPKVPGQDPEDEEYSDKQMNFGFVFGDGGIAEPYFYVTAYPLPEALPQTPLPDGTTWVFEGFSAAVLLYKDLAGMADPAAYLQEVWSTLLSAGRSHLATNSDRHER
jgi:hypothetical protein